MENIFKTVFEKAPQHKVGSHVEALYFLYLKYWEELIPSGLAHSCLKGRKIVLCILAKYVNSEQVFWGKEKGIFESI